MVIVVNYPNMPKFDILEYIKKLRNAGVSQEIAEIQGQELAHVLEEAICVSKSDVQSKELVTQSNLKELELKIEQMKLELQKEIVQSSNKTIIWVISLLSGYGVFFLGVIAKGFHWI